MLLDVYLLLPKTCHVSTLATIVAFFGTILFTHVGMNMKPQLIRSLFIRFPERLFFNRLTFCGKVCKGALKNHVTLFWPPKAPLPP